MAQFLRIAIGLSPQLRQLHGGAHSQGLKPANVMIDPATGQVWLMGFGIGSRLPATRPVGGTSRIHRGTLAYHGPRANWRGTNVRT